MGEIINFDSYAFNGAPLSEKLIFMNTTIVGFVKWCIESKKFRVVGFHEALFDMRFEKFSQRDAEFFKSVYFNIKGDADLTAYRSLVLEALVLQCLQYDLKDFFLTAFKKERHLDTRLTAIRGYSAYSTEDEVKPLVDKFIKLLTSWRESGTYAIFDYQVYEPLRSKFGLPYLIEQYGYDCFNDAMQLVEQRYSQMPDVLKGFYTKDEDGRHIQLLSHEETHKRLDAVLGR